MTSDLASLGAMAQPAGVLSLLLCFVLFGFSLAWSGFPRWNVSVHGGFNLWLLMLTLNVPLLKADPVDPASGAFEVSSRYV